MSEATLRRLVDGWSTGGKLVTQNRNQNVSLQADFTKRDPTYDILGSGVYTVQFAISKPTTGVYRAVATITWTVEGNQIVRQIDVNNGASLSAPSQAVRIQISDETPPEMGGPAGEEYGVTVFITKGTRAFSSVPATLKGLIAGSVELFTLGAGASIDVEVPENAGASSVEVTAAVSLAGVSPDILITHDNPVASFKAYKYADQGAGAGFVALSAMASLVTLKNLDVTHGALVSVTWGIDG